MSHLVKSLFVCASLFVPSLVASCACDGGDSNPATSTTGHAGSGGGVGGTSVTAGNGGTVGTAGSGGSTPINPWGSGPGRPGAVTTLVRDIPLVQGISSQNQIMNRDSTDKCTGEGGSAGSPSGGAGGVGGSSATGGAASLPWCPTDYVPMTPTLDLSGIDKTSIQLAFTTTPIFQPYNNSIPCPTARQPIEFGRIFVGDCTGVLTEIPAFTGADIDGFFGNTTVLNIESNMVVDGHRVSILSGLALKSAICGPNIFVVSNGSSKVAKFDLAPDAGFARTNYEVSEPGLSGVLCADDGTVLFSTSRVFTIASWGAGEDASLLVEEIPIRIYRMDIETGTTSVLVNVNGGSLVKSLNGIPRDRDSSGNPLNLYMQGTTNVLARGADGDILFGDHLAGAVWKISPDGQTKTKLFETGRLFTSLAQAPNGTIYLSLNATSNWECSPITPSVIAYYDELADTVVDWMTLDDPSYDDLFPSLCESTVAFEWDYPNSVRYFGGGNFNDLAADLEGNLYVTETILNRTTAIHVVFDEPDAG